RFGALAGARNHKIIGVLPRSERQVNRALALPLGQRGLFHRANDTDNREELRVIFFVAVPNSLTERAAIGVFFAAGRDSLAKRAAAAGPITPRKIFVHDADSIRSMRILRGQKPSFAQRNAEGREVVAGHAIGIMSLQRLARGRRITLRRDGSLA